MKDLGDMANDVADEKMIETLGSQELMHMKAIDAALARIHEGTYGLCATCSKKIPEERLEALPSTTQCIECQKTNERRRRG